MDQASSKLLPPNPHDPATRKPEKTKLILRREENHPKTWVSLIRLGGSEKAEGNLTRLSTRSLSWSGGLEWARSRKKYWTRRSFEGALDSLKHSFKQQVQQMEKILANLRKDVMSACKDGGG